MAFGMIRPALELAEIIRSYKQSFITKFKPHVNSLRVLHALELCRTSALGGHVDVCNGCRYVRISYNSCRNRHCPKCQNGSREQWIAQRQNDLLPVPYFHVVFTLPEQFNVYCLHHPLELYNMLFISSKETIEQFASDEKHLGAQAGMISVLHTWGQNLSLHPHVHMIVLGGGISKAGFWKPTKSKGTYLFPVKAMSIVFKHKFMEKILAFLEQKQQPMEKQLRHLLYKKDWVVYCKQPFAGPEQVIEYLGRYSHKIAISNHRIKSISDGKITFQYKDYRCGSVNKVMALDAEEFLRRFCLHILPPGFRKIRHYGILASRCKPKLRSQQMQMGLLPIRQPAKQAMSITMTSFAVGVCPCCKTGQMIRLLGFEANAPPDSEIIARLKKTVIK